MYKFIDNQIRFEDFEQPMGMNIKRQNRWIKKAESIPWAEVEKRYAVLFKNRKGNVAKPVRLALGACIIQAEYGYSDEEVVLQIQENPYLQFFCGYKAYDDSKPPFDPSLMVHFRRRLTPEILGDINALLIEEAKQEETPKDDDGTGTSGNGGEAPKNKGTLIIDATCAPQQIKYPQDIELLNKSRELTEKMIDELHQPEEGIKPRTYRKKAHKDYLAVAKMRKRPVKKLRAGIRKQLNYLRRNLATIDRYLASGKVLSGALQEKLNTIRQLFEQQEMMYLEKKHTVTDRIVSLEQPWIRPIVRGKAKAKTEFGAKLDISVDDDGFTRLEYYSFDAYNESTKLQTILEASRERKGYYPKRVLVDKIYRTRENLRYCKEHAIHLSGPALGRPKKGVSRDKHQDYQEEVERIEVERRFSLAKRKCGLGLLRTKCKETTYHCLAMSVFLLNLKKVFCALFEEKSLFIFWRLIGPNGFGSVGIIQ